MHHLVTAAREFAKSLVTALHGSWGLLEENAKTTPVGFEPTRGDPIGLAGRRLSRLAKVSSGNQVRACGKLRDIRADTHAAGRCFVRLVNIFHTFRPRQKRDRTDENIVLNPIPPDCSRADLTLMYNESTQFSARTGRPMESNQRCARSTTMLLSLPQVAIIVTRRSYCSGRRSSCWWWCVVVRAVATQTRASTFTTTPATTVQHCARPRPALFSPLPSHPFRSGTRAVGQRWDAHPNMHEDFDAKTKKHASHSLQKQKKPQ